MATRTWTGATSDDWSVTTNWADNTVPVSTDSVIIPSTSTRAILNGLSQGAVDLAELIIDAGYAQDIGSPGTPLQISCTLLKHFGSGALYYEDGAGTTDEVHINCATPATVVELGGSTITKMILLRGAVVLAGTGTIVDLHIGRTISVAGDVSVSGTGTITTVRQWGGNVTSLSGTVTEYHLMAGNCTKTSSNPITTLYQSAGVMNYNCSGTLTLAEIFSGTFNLMGTGEEKTVTDLWLYPGSNVRKDDNRLSTTLHDLRDSQ